MSGVIYLLVGPSGVGKSTLMNEVAEQVPKLERLLTATTRPPREGEQNGRDYLFISDEEFDQRIRAGDFVEHVLGAAGHQYGTPRSAILKALAEGGSLIGSVDVRGAESLEREYPGKVVTIFVEPPSSWELEHRLRTRGYMSEDEIKARLRRADEEMDYAEDFDYCLVNTDFDETVDEVKSIIQAERMHRGAAA